MSLKFLKYCFDLPITRIIHELYYTYIQKRLKYI